MALHHLVLCYLWIRRIAYALGFAGVVFLIIGKSGGEKDPWTLKAGFICVIAMPILFFCNYALYMVIQQRRSKRSPLASRRFPLEDDSEEESIAEKAVNRD